MTIHRHADRVDPRAFTLPPPTLVPGTGGRIYALALAIPGVFSYSWGDVYTSADVLKDPEYHAALVGTPIIDDDRKAHLEGVTTETMAEQAIGRMLSVEWDEAQQVLIGKAVIDVQRGLDAIDRGVVGVSAAYDGENLPEVGEVNGARYTYRQIRRVAPSNTAITLNPRQAVTRLQADALENIMEIPAEILKKMADADPNTMLMELIQMLLAAKEEGAVHKAAADGLRAKYEAEEEADPAADAEVSVTDEVLAKPEDSKVATMADAIRMADALQITIDPDWTLRQLQRAIVIGRGVPQADAEALDDGALSAVLKATKTTIRTADAWDLAASKSVQNPAKTTTFDPASV